MKNIFVRLGSTALKLLLAFALAFGLCAEGYAVPPTPTFKMLSHLGVSGKDIVQIYTLREGPAGAIPLYTGWTVLRGDGSLTDYRNVENPLVPPAGTLLVITDVRTAFSDSTKGYILLSISRNDIQKMVYSIDSASVTEEEGLFVNTYSEHMTTGFIVPPGWRLDLPNENLSHPAPNLILEGYFATVE